MTASLPQCPSVWGDVEMCREWAGGVLAWQLRTRWRWVGCLHTGQSDCDTRTLHYNIHERSRLYTANYFRIDDLEFSQIVLLLQRNGVRRIHTHHGSCHCHLSPGDRPHLHHPHHTIWRPEPPER